MVSAGVTACTSAAYGPTPRSERLAATARAATARTIATATVPWYCDDDGVAMPARLQISHTVSSGPISRPHLMQCRLAGAEVGVVIGQAIMHDEGRTGEPARPWRRGGVAG